MTTTTAKVRDSRPASFGAGPSFGRVLASEWVKLSSLASSRVLIIGTLLAIVGVGFLTAFMRFSIVDQMLNASPGMEMMGPDGQPMAPSTPETVEQAIPAGFELYNLPNAGLQLGVLVLGALAVMFIASEYSTGMIRATMTAVPKRLPVFAAKGLLLVIVSYLVSLVGAFATYFIAAPMFKSIDIDLALDREGLLSGIFLGGLFVAGVALIGLSLGVLMRNAAGGVIVLTGLFFLIPFAAQFLTLVPGDFWKYVPQYLPADVGGRMLSIGHVDGTIDPGIAGLIFLGWVLVFVIPATIVLKKRDV